MRDKVKEPWDVSTFLLLPRSPAFSSPYSHTIPCKLMQELHTCICCTHTPQHLPFPESPPCFSVFLALRDPKPSCHRSSRWIVHFLCLMPDSLCVLVSFLLLC